MFLLKCAVFESKKSKFVKKQEAKRLLCKLTGIKVPVLNASPMANIFLKKYQMNGIVNKILSEMHLKQPGFRYSACGPFNKKIMKNFKDTGDSTYIYQNELDKACFQYDMAYGDLKDLTRRTTADKVLPDKAFNIAKNPKYDRYQRGFFDEKTSDGIIKNEVMSNKELSEELHRLIFSKLERRKVCSPFIDNIWAADLADMQLISTFNKAFRFLLCIIDIFSKYAWVIPSKDKKGITFTHAFQKMVIESNRKPNKTWVDKGNEFYNTSMKLFLQNNDTEMYSAHNEGMSVIVERFIRTLKNNGFNIKNMASISKNMYIDKLDDIVNKYNDTYHSTIKMKPTDVKANTYIDSSKEINDKYSKFIIVDIVRI